MTDLRSLSDEHVIAMVQVSKGFDRELLLGCLGLSSGSTGVAYLRSLLGERGKGSGHLDGAVLNALTARLGQEAVPDLASALSGGTLETQLTAVMNIEEVDDGRAADAVLAWFSVDCAIQSVRTQLATTSFPAS